MKIKSLFIITSLVFNLLAIPQISLAQDEANPAKQYNFVYRGHSSKKIEDEDDYALFKAAERTIKEGYSYFKIVNLRKYDAITEYRNQRSNKLGRRYNRGKKLRSEITIDCFMENPNDEFSYNAHETKQKFN
ncbi:MAG: hypothetical protein HOH19_11030 [Kordiimonadaceae bacterium]|nr:hypothetical protein [Kordiimonadaceae bacterium]MBT6033101.1 hypothetical protein [Kordiimonadaceae bacterium]